MVNKGTGFFEWNINNVVLQANTWTCSPHKFILNGDDKVEFSLELRVNKNDPHDWHKLEIRVRKDDCKPANATVNIEFFVANPSFNDDKDVDEAGISFSSSKYPYLIYVPSSASQPIKTEILKWKDTYVIYDISDIMCKNGQTAVMKDICYIKNTTVRCNIIWHGFNELSSIEQLDLRDHSDICEHSDSQNFNQFRESNEFHDITLVVGDTELPAHKIILSERSPLFYDILIDLEECDENRVVINNFTAESIKELLDYFYTNKTKASSDVDVALTMIGVAEIYIVDDLKEICEKTLLKNITIDNVLNIFCAAVDLDATKLRKHSIDFMVHNRNKVVDLEKFQNFCKTKPLLMHEFVVAVCKKI